MAYDSPAWLSRRSLAGVRRLDHLEAGLCSQPKRVPSGHRVRANGAIRKVSRHGNTLRAWIILAVFSSSGGALIGAFAAFLTTRGHT